MKTVDLKCGKCHAIFPIQFGIFDGFNYDSFERKYRKNVSCPNCNSEFEKTSTLFNLLRLSGEQLEGWEFGTNFTTSKND